MQCSGKLIHVLQWVNALFTWTTTITTVPMQKSSAGKMITMYSSVVCTHFTLLFVYFEALFSNPLMLASKKCLHQMHGHTRFSFISSGFSLSFQSQPALNEHYGLIWIAFYRTLKPFIIRNMFYVILRSKNIHTINTMAGTWSNIAHTHTHGPDHSSLL